MLLIGCAGVVFAPISLSNASCKLSGFFLVYGSVTQGSLSAETCIKERKRVTFLHTNCIVQLDLLNCVVPFILEQILATLMKIDKRAQIKIQLWVRIIKPLFPLVAKQEKRVWISNALLRRDITNRVLSEGLYISSPHCTRPFA